MKEKKKQHIEEGALHVLQKKHTFVLHRFVEIVCLEDFPKC
jgi:hypothetical protein